MMDTLRRLLRSRTRWDLLMALRRNNRVVNTLVRPLSDEELARIPVEHGVLELSTGQCQRLLQCEAMRSFRKVRFLHTQPLEFLASIVLAELHEGDSILDAAGGTDAQFIRVAMEYSGLGLRGFVQDIRMPARGAAGVTFLAGSITQIPLPDAAARVVTCHNSLQLLRAEADMVFIREAVRVLQPGGNLVISPLLLSDCYAEIWNCSVHRHYDGERAATVIDQTATIASWNGTGGFARVYDSQAFRDRVLAQIPSNCTVSILRVTVEGKPVPDLRANRQEPAVLGGLKVLRVKKAHK